MKRMPVITGGLMVVYHGTTLDTETIKREGLKPMEPGEIVEMVLAEFPCFQRRGSIPKNVVQYIGYELAYRSWQHENEPDSRMKVHTTLSWKQAVDFGRRRGGEFADNIRWACNRSLRLPHEYAYFVSIVSAVVPISEAVLEAMDRCRDSEFDFDDIAATGSWDETFDRIEPYQIIDIEEVRVGDWS